MRLALPLLALLAAACGGLRSGTPDAGQGADGGGGTGSGDGGGEQVCAADAGRRFVPAASLDGLGKINDLAFDSTGKLYVLGSAPDSQVRVLGPGPEFPVVASLGLGFLGSVGDLDVGPKGEVFVVDTPGGTFDARRVVQLSLDGTKRAFDAGTSLVSAVELPDAGLILATSEVRMWSSTRDGAPQGEIPLAAFLTRPEDLKLAPDGTVWTPDAVRHKLYRFHPVTGQVRAQLGAQGSGPGEFDGAETIVASPSHLAVDAAGRLFVDDFYNHRVQWFLPSGAWLGELPVINSTYPWALGVDPRSGRLFVGGGSVIEIFCVPP